MGNRALTGKDLRKLGYPEGRIIGDVLKVLEKHYKGKSRKYKLDLIKRVIKNPPFYLNN